MIRPAAPYGEDARLVPLATGDERVVVPDLRGHGRSPHAEGGHTVEQYADDLAALLDALDVGRCVVVGWSMGSLVAWEMMHRHGRERVAGHVVLSQGPTDLQSEDFPDAPLSVAAIHGFVAGVQADFAGAIAGFAPAMFKQPLAEEDVAWCVAESTLLGANAASSILLHQTLYDARTAIAAGTVPTLLVWGADEKLIPLSMGHWCAANIPGAELHVFEDSGHCPQLEEPGRTAAAIADWAAARL